ncbi:MAG TPA: Do family serine endopeptidase [Myxococcaceae bacterium]|nr:Do family serine endopeptidase [Myxococcaceae bacterium]
MNASTARSFALALSFALGSSPAAAQPQAATRDVQALPSFSRLVESVKSAVVNVEVQSRVRGPLTSERPGADLFEQFFGGGRGWRPREEYRQGAGSGFIIDPKGLILTNNHVVEDAVNIRITLDDARSFDAQIVGRDPLTDVAVIRIKQKVENLPTVKLGDSEAMKVGDWVVAIGNPFGLASSVSAGIISATARNVRITAYDDLIQTDAAINPGNSGGPLFNTRGDVIGMNTAIVGGGAGIGFAVPSNMVKALLPQLEKNGKVVRGYLGVALQDLNPDLAQALRVPTKSGAIVTEVTANSPASKVLKSDDVITEVSGQKVESSHALSRMVALLKPGTEVTLKVYRGGQARDVKIVLGTRPDLEGVFRDEGGRSSEEDSQRQRLGLGVQDMDPRFAQGNELPAQGALVREVRPGSPAERAQLRPGQVIVEAGGKPVKAARDLERAIKETKAGSMLLLRVVDPENGPALRALQIPG